MSEVEPFAVPPCGITGPMASTFSLCFVTDRHAIASGDVFPRIVEAVRAGVDLVQVREKDLGTRPLLELVAAAVAAARGTQSRVVVNDRLDVALAAGASGIHLGTQSLPAEAVRRLVAPGFLVGVSCHLLDEALAAERARADYIFLGPIFPTPSKAAFGPPLGLDKLREVRAQVKIPIVAIGGVTVERVKACLEAGAAGIAGIRLFQDCDSLEERVEDLRAQFAA